MVDCIIGNSVKTIVSPVLVMPHGKIIGATLYSSTLGKGMIASQFFYLIQIRRGVWKIEMRG